MVIEGIIGMPIKDFLTAIKAIGLRRHLIKKGCLRVFCLEGEAVIYYTEDTKRIIDYKII